MNNEELQNLIRTFGQVTPLDNGIIINDDAIKVMRKIKSNNVDVVITDAPYGVRTEGWDNNKVIIEGLREAIRIAKKGVVWFATSSFLINLPYREYFHRILTWVKPIGTQYTGAKHNNLFYDTEFIIVYAKTREMIKPRGKVEASTYIGNNVPSKKYGHPTTKPLGLMRKLVEHYSDENDLVLDCFMGTGTTGVASIELNRRFVGIEINKTYFNIAKERLKRTKPNKNLKDFMGDVKW